ncbi:histone deacetylase family protein [Roseofilum casamattae]|uniref:Histone deacetylase n=1 Tax=Roseofilum casamattae BLCC-M143 TaxID=3022442 RepID=A0ABT7C033_9CYAN|nr:histone deacetylase [Roseofilum casamattae]MDJ1184809.1 histone deacetylase [Roseofilum casamattae BLCC-M143]
MLSDRNYQPKLIFSPNYDLKFLGLENLHPFDGCKYSKAWKELKNRFGSKIDSLSISPSREASIDELSLVHDRNYLLNSLRSSTYLAQALELSPLKLLPYQLIDRSILKPMRLATMGTITAAKYALENGLAVNLSGGYHHASQDAGEGFCLYSDIGIAIRKLIQDKLIGEGNNVLIIDLDAHQGNGLERIFYDDPNIYILDMYNQNIYPQDRVAQKRINYDIPLPSRTEDNFYLNTLQEHLVRAIAEINTPKIAFYNAGTDIYCNDPLGNLSISEQGILERDRLIFKMLSDANIPCVMVLSGGYIHESYKLISNSISLIIEEFC